jgi:hypothetical protein
MQQTNRNETKPNETKRNQTKRNETDRNETKRNQEKQNDCFPKRNVMKKNEKFNMAWRLRRFIKLSLKLPNNLIIKNPIHRLVCRCLSVFRFKFWLGKINDYCGKHDYISDYTIPGYPLRRASQTFQKLFEVTLLYLYCRREKTIKGGNFLWRMKCSDLSFDFQCSDVFFFFAQNAFLY